jgi:hypothetical protein
VLTTGHRRENLELSGAPDFLATLGWTRAALYVGLAIVMPSTPHQHEPGGRRGTERRVARVLARWLLSLLA